MVLQEGEAGYRMGNILDPSECGFMGGRGRVQNLETFWIQVSMVLREGEAGSRVGNILYPSKYVSTGGRGRIQNLETFGSN
jgi:hypothetical protein